MRDRLWYATDRFEWWEMMTNAGEKKKGNYCLQHVTLYTCKLQFDIIANALEIRAIQSPKKVLFTYSLWMRNIWYQFFDENVALKIISSNFFSRESTKYRSLKRLTILL
jgi:hypothetical protein